MNYLILIKNIEENLLFNRPPILIENEDMNQMFELRYVQKIY